MTQRLSFYEPPEGIEEELELQETLDGFKIAFEELDSEMLATRAQLRTGNSRMTFIIDCSV